MRKILLILSVFSLTLTSCKNDENQERKEQKEVLEISTSEKLTQTVDKETPTLEDYKNNIYPMIVEVGKDKDWTLIMHVAKKAYDAPNEDVFKANYSDLTVLLNKELQK